MKYRPWLFSLLAFCVVLMAAGSLAAAPAAQETSSSSVSPDQPDQLKPAEELTLEERERLLSLTRVVVASSSKEASQDEAESTGDSTADAPDAASEVEALDQLLAKLSRDRSRAASDLMMKALDSSEAGMRLTALQWLVGRDDVAAEALTRALRDRNALIRDAAENLLLVRGASDDAIGKVRAAREKSREELLLEVQAALASIE
jgi:hypothetical protein